MNKGIGLEQLKTLLSPLLALIGRKADKAEVYKQGELADVATSGRYRDLSGKPTLSTVAHSGQYDDLEGKPDFAAVATSGRYNDLSGLPTIPDAASFLPVNTTMSLTTEQKKNVNKTIFGYDGTTDSAASQLPSYSQIGAGLMVGSDSRRDNISIAPEKVTISNFGSGNDVCRVYIASGTPSSAFTPKLNFSGFVQYDTTQSMTDAPVEISGVKAIILNSSTSGSTKKFKITVDDTGTLSAVEVTK